MNLSLSIKKIFSLLSKSRRIAPAVSVALQAVGKQLSPITNLPDGKTEIPPLIKTTVFPLPVVICGSVVAGRPNFNTLANFGLISPSRPNPVIYISSNKTHHTNTGIRKNGVFSINIPSRAVMAQTDYLGVVSGRTTDKSGVMTVFYGRNKDAPCLAECPLNYICKVIQHLEIREKDLFIGEIVESFVTSRFLTEKAIDIERMEPLLYTADNKYRIPGASVGNAYNIYKEMFPDSAMAD